ncbi:hypothetical protein GOODEAATRI_008533 [Goodea atripinnis]|uniref:Uncharacterized protein n=1 Tax=Goodea atripinnis TaxID=208336 RepID=A0ABV0NIK0_9TELE
MDTRMLLLDRLKAFGFGGMSRSASVLWNRITFNAAHIFPVIFFHISSFHCFAMHMCLYADFTLSFSHGFLLLPIPFPSTAPPSQPPLKHTTYSGEDQPCVVQAVSPLSHLSPSLFLSFPPAFHPPSPECLDRSKWCDCVCPAGRLPLSVFGKSDVSGGRGRREKAEAERKRGKVFLNNKAWRPSRESNPASQVSSPAYPSFYSLFLAFSHTLFLGHLFPVECPIFSLLSTVSLSFFHFLSPPLNL